MFSELPSFEGTVTCDYNKCKNNKNMSVMYIKYNTMGDLTGLQNYIVSRIGTESSIRGYKDGNN